MLESFFVGFFFSCFCFLRGYMKEKESISVIFFIILTYLSHWKKFRINCFATISIYNSELLVCILYSVDIFIDRDKLMVAIIVVSIAPLAIQNTRTVMKILLPCQYEVSRVGRQFSKHLTNGHHIAYFSDLAFHLILGKTERENLICICC